MRSFSLFRRAVFSLLLTLSLLLSAAPSLPARSLPPPPSPIPNPNDANAPVVTKNSVSAVVGQPFTFQVRATHAPTSYNAANLPPGLYVDFTTGVISGTPTLANAYTVNLRATNSFGTGEEDLQLVVFLRPLPVVTLTFETDATLSGGSATPGSFLLTRTGGNISDQVRISYTVTGSAVGGVNYASLKGTANVKGNQGTKHLKVTPLASDTTDGKTVKVKLQPGVGYLLGDQISAKLKLSVTE